MLTVTVSFALLLAAPVVLAQRPGSTPAPRPQPAAASRFHEPAAFDFNEHTGFTQIFDGRTLNGWDGDPAIWRVENGAMVGESTDPRVRPPNTYISYHGLDAGKTDADKTKELAVSHDFDLKLEVMVEHGGGTGIQYRGTVGGPWIHARPNEKLAQPGWRMSGPQADFWFPVDPTHEQYTGQFYSENTDLGIQAYRGQVTQSSAAAPQRLVGTVGDRHALGGYVQVNGWNQYEIIARGPVMMHILNGQLMAVFIDDDPKSSNNISGLIGIELEGTPTKISVRNIWLRKIN